MKLRNKKTGEIVDLAKRGLLKSDNDNHIIVYPEGTLKYYAYNSLAELNEEWEDYKPEEPKLSGEVREIVKHWANLHGYDWVKVGFIKRNAQTIFHVVSPDANKRIEFSGAYVADDFEAGDYSIAELCGEEEE